MDLQPSCSPARRSFRGMEFRLLGSLEVVDAGERIQLGGLQQRRILSILLCDPGRTLTYERLLEALWPDGDAPDNARRTAISYVSRLRAALGDGWIDTTDAGYCLDIAAASVDSVRFAELLESARVLAADAAVAGARRGAGVVARSGSR